MTKKPAQRVKHIPQRTCVGCRQVLPKRQMIRIVRAADGIKIDPTGKLAGRGAYLHDLRSCWERGLKGALGNALKVELSAEDRAQLENYVKTLPQQAEARENAMNG